MINLSEFTAQVRALQARMPRVEDGKGTPDGGLDVREAYEALNVAVEELAASAEEHRRQADELRESRWALEREQRRYRDLFEDAPDAYLVTDPLGVVREANRKAVDLFAVRKRFLLGKPLVLFVAEEVRPAFRSELTRLGAGTAPGGDRYEFRMTPRGQPPFEAEVSVTAVTTEGGRPTSLRWTVRDVTDRRQVEDRLRLVNLELEKVVRERTAQLKEESREREHFLIRTHTEADVSASAFVELIHNLDAIIWAVDARSGAFTFVSRGAQELLGYSPEAWAADPGFWASRVHPDDRGFMIERRERQLREGSSHESEYRMVAADGRHVWFREAVRVTRDEGGRPLEVRGLMVNISRRKKVERQLYAHRNELSARLEDLDHLHTLSGRLSATLELQPILEEVLAGVMSVQGALKGVIRLLDRDRGELVLAVATGFPEAFLGFTARLPIGAGACGIAIATGNPFIIADVRAEGVGETDREAARLGDYRATFSIPLWNRTGDLVGTIATYFDEPHHPSPRQVRLVELFAGKAADAIENAAQYREAREAGRSRDVFLTVLAHELRNPLNAIHAALALLDRRDLEEPEQAEVRASIERQVGRLDRLIGDLLDSSRIAAGKLALSRVPTDLRQVVRDAIESTRAEVSGRGHTLRAAIDDAPLWAHVDPARIEQVFVNLLTNAARYTPPGGRITASAARQEGAIVVRVRDNGIGIAPGGLSRIFDMFAQDGSASAARREGLGVGLSLVQRFVEMHDGRVTAASAGLGHGTEFTVTLPSIPAPTGAAPGPRSEAPLALPAPAPHDPSPAPLRILVVDDQVESAVLLARLLRARGHDVAVAHDGPSALDVARAHPPHVVLLDVGLPGMDGVEVARLLREQGQDARIVALTGYQLAGEARAAFDGLLIKPVNDRDLRSELDRAPPPDLARHDPVARRPARPSRA